MDAYVLAQRATFDEVAALAALAAPRGPIRVVCPLVGDFELYVALDAPDEATAVATAESIADRPGVSGAGRYIPLPGGLGGVGVDSAKYPTHCAVDMFVGFALLGFTDAVPPHIELGVPGVVGTVAVRAENGGQRLLVEVTGPDAEGVQASLDALGTVSGLTVEGTATGDVRPAAGFTVEPTES